MNGNEVNAKTQSKHHSIQIIEINLAEIVTAWITNNLKNLNGFWWCAVI